MKDDRYSSLRQQSFWLLTSASRLASVDFDEKNGLRLGFGDDVVGKSRSSDE
jgi:hypothetical protein